MGDSCPSISSRVTVLRPDTEGALEMRKHMPEILYGLFCFYFSLISLPLV